MHTTNQTPTGGALSFVVAAPGNAARSGVGFPRGHKSKRPDVEASGRLEVCSTLLRSPRGACNTTGATCTEGNTDARTYQSDGVFSPGRLHKHTSSGRR